MTSILASKPGIALLLFWGVQTAQAAQGLGLVLDRHLVLTAGQTSQVAQPAPRDAVLRGESQVEWIKTPRPPLLSPATATSPHAPVDEPSAEWNVLLADRTFFQTLQRWTRTAGWQLVWEVDRDFAIDAQVSLQGSFLEVLDISMRSLLSTDYPLQAQVNEKTRVVRITRYLLDGQRR